MSSLLNSYNRITRAEPISNATILTADGDPSSDPNIVSDYSSGVTKFYYQAPAGVQATVKKFYFAIGDVGTFDLAKYGSLASALTNGIVIGLELNGVDFDFPILYKTNSDLVKIGYRVDILDYGAGQQLVTGAIDLGVISNTAGSGGFALNGNTNDKLYVKAQDNFTGLAEHNFAIDVAEYNILKV